MSIELLWAVALYGLVTSITPGPNNTMLLASGLNFGMAKTMPHVWGINIGFTGMIIGVGLGLGAVFAAFPVLHLVLKIVGSAYLVYLAWRIATSGPMGDEIADKKPFTFVEAAAFQWVNPKAWVMAVGAISAYVPPDQFLIGVFSVALVFGAVNFPSILLWAGFGAALRNVLTNPKAVVIFNLAMAALLIGSLWPTLRELAALGIDAIGSR
jgi:threonine/homoserine/homoserine lactone efflux protein